MKNFFTLLAALLLLASCDNELDISADYKETTVVYGLLNPNEPVQYIQVFKGFLDENTSALVLAQNPDSIFYDDSVEVKLQAAGQTFILEKIDAAQLGLSRNPGIFVTDPNFVYRLTQPLLQDQNYLLTFTNQRTGHVVTAQSAVVKDFDVTRPIEAFPVNLINDVDVQWRSAANGRIYQLVIRFYYEEWKIATPNEVDTLFLDWDIFNGQVSATANGNENMTFRFDGKQFFSFVKNRLTVDINTRRRAIAKPLEFHFYVGGEELYNYIRVNSAQTGITSLSVQPEYTNVNNGLGIFSSRYNKFVKNIMLSERSLDTLSCSALTRSLNFVNTATCN